MKQKKPKLAVGNPGAVRRRKWVSLFGLLCASFAVVASVIGGFSGTAMALVPRGHRVIEAVASANVSGHRVQALRFELTLQIGAGAPVAVGELVSHPTGLARLELRASGGLIERHILLGEQHSAARNARLLVRPRAFLPPLFVLQASSVVVLEAALNTLGIDRDLVGLAPCGDNDCYVIGDPARAVPRARARIEGEQHARTDAKDRGVDVPRDDPNQLAGQRSLSTPGGERAGEQDAGASEAGEPASESFATLWIDTVDHSVRRMETREGVRLIFGPYVKFERLTVPKWWTIEEPGKRPVRFEIVDVTEVNAPAGAFSKTWLMAPVAEAPPAGPSEQRASIDGDGDGGGNRGEANGEPANREGGGAGADGLIENPPSGGGVPGPKTAEPGFSPQPQPRPPPNIP